MDMAPAQYVSSMHPITRHLLLVRNGLPWLCLLWITAAELMIAFAFPLQGLALHATLVIALTLHAAIGRGVAKRRLSFGLTIAPLLRLLALTLPLTTLPQIARYAAVSLLLLIGATIMTRQLALSRFNVGLCRGNLFIQLMLLGIGPALGLIEYLILRPAPLLIFATWHEIWLPALILVIFTGFSEEFIFRGLLPAVGAPVLGRWTICYSALLFAVMHVGYRSTANILFVFTIGLLFGQIVHWGGSILGVSLTHGLTNVGLLLIIPQLVSVPAQVSLNVGLGVIAGGTPLAVVGILLLWLRARPVEQPLLVTPDLPNVRSLRRAACLSYVELAQRSGVSARVIAEIEHGWCRPKSEYLRLIVEALASGYPARIVQHDRNN
jgi:membrane protease YdiL (CAAX protease family)